MTGLARSHPHGGDYLREHAVKLTRALVDACKSESSEKKEDAVPKQRSILRGFIQERRTMLASERINYFDSFDRRPRFDFDEDDDP